MKIFKYVSQLIVITLVLLLISQVRYVSVMKNEEKRSWQELGSTADIVANEIETKFNDEIAKLKFIESIIINDDVIAADEISLLHLDTVQPNTIFKRIDILYPDNTIVSNGKEKIIHKDINFDKIEKKGEYLTDRKTDFLTGNPCVYYVIPVMKSDAVSSVLIGVVDLTTLTEIFKPIIYNGEANICIIDSEDGSYIMDSWHEELGNAFAMPDRTLLESFKDVDFKKEIRELKTGTIAFESFTTGKNIYMYYTPIQKFDWELAIFATEEVLFSNLTLLKQIFIFASVLEIMLVIVFFCWNLIIIKQLKNNKDEVENQRKQLEELSYKDILTSMYNRRKYIMTLDYLSKNMPKKIGTAYIDLNGLKRINDFKSHEMGDVFICNCAKVISEIFGEKCYRIGGDEFVVLSTDTEKEQFESDIEKLYSNMDKYGISFSVGYVWKEECEDLQKMLNEAEKNMYIEKEKYYEHHKRNN